MLHELNHAIPFVPFRSPNPNCGANTLEVGQSDQSPLQAENSAVLDS